VEFEELKNMIFLFLFNFCLGNKLLVFIATVNPKKNIHFDCFSLKKLKFLFKVIQTDFFIAASVYFNFFWEF
jgi:hypothetical protein